MKKNFIFQLVSQVKLAWQSRKGDCTLCFSNLPPMFRIKGEVKCFVQNRNIVAPLKFRLKISFLKLSLQKFLLLSFKSNVNQFIVQTASMELLLQKFLRSRCDNVKVIPFSPKMKSTAPKINQQIRFDFLFVSDGVAHKNHINLLEAWRILKAQGVEVGLAVTLTSRDFKIKDLIKYYKVNYEINVTDVGHIPATEMPDLYRGSSALIFPSVSESFGLPL